MAGNFDESSTEPGRDRLDTTGEFFSVGTPLHAVRAGYVRRGADDVLFDNAIAGRYAHIIAPDRSGKSSLVAATAARLENQGIKIAILDLGQIGARDAGTDEGRWYYSVAYRLMRQLRIRIDLQAWWQDKSILGTQQRLVEFYSEVVLQNVQESIVVFVDEIQCTSDLPFADQLLPSIRAAHNARATDPEFTRLTFVLLGECDSLSLIDEPELSPFNITQPVVLGDFSRADLDLFATELNLEPQDANTALDRIYYWTRGQPYLSQKLARAVSRERFDGDVTENVDRIAMHQLAGRAALYSEPHMSHIHRAIVNDPKRSEGLLTLYGRIRVGAQVSTDLGSPLQRRLIALGLLRIDEEGQLGVRNRLYEAVFTARWANDNLPVTWRAPAVAVMLVLLIVALPFWYTQLLPGKYFDALTSPTVDLDTARDAYRDYRSFPGHAVAADSMFRNFLRSRAAATDDADRMEMIAALAAELPDAGGLPDELRAEFWDRGVAAAVREERRDDALLASLQSLVHSTPLRRGRAASLVAEDYPLLLASLPGDADANFVFDPENLLLTTTRGGEVDQWSVDASGLHPKESWTITALEVAPLVRRVIVDRQGEVTRVGLTLNLSHARVGDLRIKVIAPSGRAVEVDPGVARAASNEDLRIPGEQLRSLIGEPLGGTWSISLRDEALGVAGQLVGWNLVLNSQGVVEDFQRGLNIADPVERETENLWFSPDGRYAIARATRSDSVRVWDLAFARPVRAIAVSELEQIVGLSRGARRLVTATQDSVNLWDTATGHRAATLPIGAVGATTTLTADGGKLLVQRRGDAETTFELWSLEDAEIGARLAVAGTPDLVAIDRDGSRIAVADYDRAVRLWEMRDGIQVAQVDLDSRPSRIELAAGGRVLGVVYGEGGVSLWRADHPQQPLFEDIAQGTWQLAFSPSGTLALVGRSGQGFQVFDTEDGGRLGPVLGMGAASGDAAATLAFSADERTVITAAADGLVRFWRVPTPAEPSAMARGDQPPLAWPGAGGAVAAVSPDTTTVAFGSVQGDVLILPLNGGAEALARASDDVSYFGHNSEVRHLAFSADGSRIASVAADNTLRVWDAAERSPSSFVVDIPGDPVDRCAFSPDAEVIAVLNRTAVQLVDAGSGDVLARFDLGEVHRALSFANSEQAYVGSDSGALRVIGRGAAGQWQVEELWRGDAGIRWLEASPRGDYLVLVDSSNIARLFDLAGGRIGAADLNLPSAVQEVAFAPAQPYVFLRTTGWIHRAVASPAGLTWTDAELAPEAFPGAGMVFGITKSAGHRGSAGHVFLPVAGPDFLKLAELAFSADRRGGLFGTREQLLAEWRRRLGRSLMLVAAQRSDQQL